MYSVHCREGSLLWSPPSVLHRIDAYSNYVSMQYICLSIIKYFNLQHPRPIRVHSTLCITFPWSASSNAKIVDCSVAVPFSSSYVRNWLHQRHFKNFTAILVKARFLKCSFSVARSKICLKCAKKMVLNVNSETSATIAQKGGINKNCAHFARCIQIALPPWRLLPPWILLFKKSPPPVRNPVSAPPQIFVLGFFCNFFNQFCTQ